MTRARIEPVIDEKEYLIEKVSIDNVPDLRLKLARNF